MNYLILDKIIKNALEEDIFSGDITSELTIPQESIGKAFIKAKQGGIVCGFFVAKRLLEIVDSSIKFNQLVNEGAAVKNGDIVARMEGPIRSLLTAERTLLNFMQRMSGIATLTKEFSDKVKGTNAKIVDTRKTVPGLRILDKYSVTCGGGTNHRFCLADGILIKDNHIKAAGGVKKAILSIKDRVPHTIKVEVETSNIDEVMEALGAKADIIMLDNMSVEEMTKAVKVIGGRALVEASGNVNLETVTEIAETGVDIISIGALTHSVKAFDLSMKIE